MLVDVIKKHGLKYGDFTLASGAKSNFYLDIKAVSLSFEGLDAICAAIMDIIVRCPRFDAIGGPTIGADPIVGALIERYQIEKGFLIRPKDKQHGLGGRLVGNLKSGDNVILIEDVVTSGGSLLDAANFVIEMECTVIAAIAVVDRGQNTTEKFPCPFYSLTDLSKLGLQ